MPPQFRRPPPFDSADDEEDEDEDEDDDEDEHMDEETGRRCRLQAADNGDDANQINDELKYGAGHRSLDSNPVESQSEWSDDECREEATGE